MRRRLQPNVHSVRRKLQPVVREAGETNCEYAVKLVDLQRKWHTTMKQVQEAIGLEQFLGSLPLEKKV